MNPNHDAYFFIIFPKFIQTKGFVLDRKLPQFSISAFIDSLKIDQITIIPTKEQTMYHTIFWLNSGRLEFQQSYHKQGQLVRIEVYDQSQMVGRVFLSSNDYIKCMEEGKEHYFCERVKISESYEMDFQLFLAGSRYEMEELLVEHRGESDIRTPITKQSQERKDDSQLNFDMLKLAQSELYSPASGNGLEEKRSIFHKIDEEESINSSLPQSAPPVANGSFSFKIELKEVPPVQMKKSKEMVEYCDKGQVRRLGSLGWKQKATLYLFTGLSLVMIYFSMIPIRKI